MTETVLSKELKHFYDGLLLMDSDNIDFTLQALFQLMQLKSPYNVYVTYSMLSKDLLLPCTDELRISSFNS